MDLSEVDRQPYHNCVISSGLVHDAPPDDIYLRFARDGEEPTTITMRQDEAIRIAALLCNAVWSAQFYPPAESAELTDLGLSYAEVDAALKADPPKGGNNGV